MNKQLSRKEKIELLKTIAGKGKPEVDLWIMHTPLGILDPDRTIGKGVMVASTIDDYIHSVQRDNPFCGIVVHTISLDEYNKIAEEIEAEI